MKIYLHRGWHFNFKWKTFIYKKVLLRERKRHTARRVVSTPSVVLPGYPPRGGYLTRVPPPGGVPDPGTPPPGGYPDPPGGLPDLGTPPGGVPDPGSPPGGYLTRVPPRGGTWPGYPPGGGTWPGPPPGGGTRTPLPPRVDRQTKWNYYLPVVLRTRAVKMHKDTYLDPDKSFSGFL